jgi:nucleotide-binding universal stress UspA family protein
MPTETKDERPVIVCYDGSPEARQAVRFAADLVPGAHAIVLTIWKPISEALLAVSLGPAPLISDPVDADERQRRAADELARDGARRASEAGLRAEPIAVQAKDAISDAIIETANEHDARLIVCGAQERATSLETAVLARVPIALLLRADRPVLVVPAATKAQAPRRVRKLRTAAR